MPAAHRARVLKPTAEGVSEAGRVLAKGELCAFPTETVYGLGANALNESAVMRIFETKRRPLSDPLIVHVKDVSSALNLVELGADDSARRRAFLALTSTFWPGPLTIVAPSAPHLPTCLSAGSATVGVRCPSHPLALALIEAADVPVAAPSANLFGHVSPTSARHVLDDLGDQDIYILDGQDEGSVCEHGIESTVCGLNDSSLIIYRRGAVTRRDLEDVVEPLGLAVVDKLAASQSTAQPKPEVSPGQLLTHYAPHLPAFLASVADDAGEQCRSSDVVVDFGRKLACLEPHVLSYHDLSPHANPQIAANNLFSTLRWAENLPGAERVILADLSDNRADSGLVAGVADRTYRAASGRRLLLMTPPDHA